MSKKSKEQLLVAADRGPTVATMGSGGGERAAVGVGEHRARSRGGNE